MSPEILGLLSLGSLFICIFAGFPIAFTEKEAGLSRWHAQFMKTPDKRKVTERSEQETDQMTEQVMRMPEPAVQPKPT